MRGSGRGTEVTESDVSGAHVISTLFTPLGIHAEVLGDEAKAAKSAYMRKEIRERLALMPLSARRAVRALATVLLEEIPEE